MCPVPRPKTSGGFVTPSRSRRGFSILEIAVGFVVMGLLATIAIPTYNRVAAAASMNRAEEQMAVIGRAAAANAAVDNMLGTTTAHFLESLKEISVSEAASVGVNAQAFGPPELTSKYALYTQEQWQELTAYPDHGSRQVMVTVTSQSVPVVAGLATLAPHDNSQCVMVSITGVTMVRTHSAPVANPLECDGELAAAGPPDLPGTGGPVPGGPLPGPPPRVFAFNMWTGTGSFDDFAATAGEATIASDNFDASDGVLLPGANALWYSLANVGLPVVVEGRLTGTGPGAQHAAVVQLSGAAWSASAKVATLPTDGGFMQLLVASTLDGEVSHLVSVGAGGVVSFGGRPVECPSSSITATNTGAVVQPGDRVGVDRTSDNVASVTVNGAVVQTIDRTTLPNPCG